MKKNIPVIFLIGILIFVLTGCEKEPVYDKYDYTFLGTFDTVVQVVGYTETEEEFNKYAEEIQRRMLELHQLFDKYNTYEGMNNIKTINDNAGIKPVEVRKEIIDLILFSKKMYEEVGNQANIAMGSVLKIWSEYRDEAELDPSNAKIPPMEDLLRAKEHTDIDKVVVDTEKNTVYLEDPLMSVDVGAVAKGFATEIAVQEIAKEGFTSGIISAGGNIRAIDKPLDGIRDRWGIGIRNPDSNGDTASNLLDTVYLNNSSVVSSGDYERFYMVGDKRIHHIIDPETLMPGDYYRAITVVTEDSGKADFLSTTLFLMPYEESRALVESLDDVEAMWVFKDGSVEATEGMAKMMKSHGASGAD